MNPLYIFSLLCETSFILRIGEEKNGVKKLMLYARDWLQRAQPSPLGLGNTNYAESSIQHGSMLLSHQKVEAGLSLGYCVGAPVVFHFSSSRTGHKAQRGCC